MVSIITVLLLLIQPVAALGMVFENGMDPVLIAEESDSGDESHEGSDGSQRKGGYGQGGSEQGGSSGTGAGSGGGGSGAGSGSSGGSGGSGAGSGSSGGSDGSSGSGGGKPVETGGTKTLNVTVVWPVSVTPQEVEITLTNGEISQTKETVNGKVIFLTEPGDEWALIGESVPGFKIPLVHVAIKGSDEEVYITLTYEEGNIDPKTIILNKTNLELFVGDKAALFATVDPINANDKTVVWMSDDENIATVNNGVVNALAEGTATITVKSTLVDSLSATCKVIVNPLEGAVRVDGITLNTNQINLDLGNNDTYELIATVSPYNATVKDILWSSSNNNVASVDEDGVITANSTGFAVITATTVDGDFYALAQVSVGAAPEVVYIYPFSESSTDEHFDSPYEVFINVEGLKAKLLSENALPEDGGILYYVKVTEKGTTVPLGESTVLITKDSVKFNLYEVTKFTMTENYSNRYFVYMSQYPDYPKDDEKTLMTNFMGGSSTPTIPLENIRVKVKIYGGTKSVEGIYVLLAREEYEGTTLKEVSWKEFYETTPPQYPYQGDNGVDIDNFIDEVKLKGITDENGVVQWFEPKETMKLGGYLLLEITPNEYKDNLNMVNPASDDGDLLKQVTLKRDSILNVEITNIYVGKGSNDNPPVNPPADPPVKPPVDPPVNPPANPPSGGEGTSTDSASKVTVLSSGEYVNIEDTEKLNGHWAKKFVDNIVKRNNMPKSIFERISNLDNDAYFSDLIELDSFMNKTNMSSGSSVNLNLPITRQQAVVMIMTSFSFSPEDEPLSFIDQNEIDANAKGFIAAACKLGIVSGYPDNSFRPNKTLTNAELLTIVSKCLDIKYVEVIE